MIGIQVNTAAASGSLCKNPSARYGMARWTSTTVTPDARGFYMGADTAATTMTYEAVPAVAGQWVGTWYAALATPFAGAYRQVSAYVSFWNSSNVQIGSEVELRRQVWDGGAPINAGGTGVNQGAAVAPSGTATARIRYASPAAAGSTSIWINRIAIRVASTQSAAAAPLPNPVWTDVLADSLSIETVSGVELSGVEETLLVGSLVLKARGSNLDPANGAFRRGAEVRLFRTITNNPEIWSGVVEVADATYDDKGRANVTVQCLDGARTLADASAGTLPGGTFGQQVAAACYAAGLGLKDSAGNFIAPSTGVASRDDSATAETWLRRVTNTHGGAVYIDAQNSPRALTAAELPSTTAVTFTDRPWDGTNRVADSTMSDPSNYAVGKRFGNTTGWYRYVAGSGAWASGYDFSSTTTAYFNLLPQGQSEVSTADKSHWLKVDAGEVYTLRSTVWYTCTRYRWYLNCVRGDGTTTGVNGPWRTGGGSTAVPIDETFTIPADVVAIAPRLVAEGEAGQTFRIYGEHSSGTQWSLSANVPSLDYTDIQVAYGSRSLTNALTVKRINLDEDDEAGKVYGPYIASDSELAYGRVSAEVETVGGVPVTVATRILSTYATPRRFVSSVTVRGKDNLDAVLALKPYDRVRVKRGALLDETYRVMSVEHSISPDSWLTTFTFKPLEQTEAVDLIVPEMGADTGPGDIAGAGFPRLARRSRSTTLSTTSGTTVVVPWTQELNAEGITYTSNGRLTVPRAGRYHISASLSFAPNATGARVVDVRVNGTNFIRGRVVGWASTDNIVSASQTLRLSAGDYVDVAAVQNSGSTLAIQTDTNSTFISIAYVGP